MSSSSTQIVLVALLFPLRLNRLFGSFLILSLASDNVESLANLNSVINPFTTASASVASISSPSTDSSLTMSSSILSTL